MDISNSECEKTSFWKKNTKAVPGRPSPKQELRTNKQKAANSSTSFQDFQASVSDAWDMDDDEFSLISGLTDAKISKKVSHSAALNVINTHRSSAEESLFANKELASPVLVESSAINEIEKHLVPELATKQQEETKTKKPEEDFRVVKPSVPDVRIHVQFPGRPQPFRCTLQEDCKTKLEKFQVLLESLTLNLTDLCQVSWSGVPLKVRAVTWRLLSGYLPVNLERRQAILESKRFNYWNLVKQYYDTDRDEAYQDTYRQIHIDIPRMNPVIPLFQQNTVQEMFERILFIWAIRHPASGYVQGINDLVTPFYVVFLQEVMSTGENFETFQVDTLTQEQRDVIEADSFWCLSKFLDGIQDNYVFAQLGIQKKVNQLKDLIQRIDAPLHRHLQNHGVDYLQFSFRWMNNLLTRELPLHCTIRLWDTYLAESDTFASFQLYVCAAFLVHWRDQLMREQDFQGLMILLQNLPTQNWTNSHISLLVAEAYRWKFMFADAPNHLHTGQTTQSAR